MKRFELRETGPGTFQVLVDGEDISYCTESVEITVEPGRASMRVTVDKDDVSVDVDGDLTGLSIVADADIDVRHLIAQ